MNRPAAHVRAEPTGQPSSREPAPRQRAARMASGPAIREAATALFLERGYAGTTMDDIAAAAHVSKQTIYTHFADKESLLASLVLANSDRVDGFLGTMVSVVHDTAGLEEGLRELARLYLRFVIRPEVLRMRRLVLAEAGRFPELARMYYEQVPQRVYATLAGIFTELAQQGRLEVEDAGRAAEHFAWLVLGAPLDRGMFYDSAEAASTANDASADAAVRVFLAGYSPR